mmetsp:Transcript_17273/g.25357  ORF Transcript_17273/g.25357 Transcript_17273/m.25357 type:complete len:557 (+) Transcript_17273:110-1780(+)
MSTGEQEKEKEPNATNEKKVTPQRSPPSLKHPSEKKIMPVKSKSVRFEQDPINPAKIKLGKANITRDVSIFVGIMAILLLISLVTVRDVGKDDGSESLEEKMAKSMKALSDIAKRNVEEAEAAKKKFADGACHALYAESSVPGGGMGLFSTKRLEQGDTVIPRSMLLPISDLIEEDESKLYLPNDLPQHAFLVKPHPTMANVKSIPVQDDNGDFATFIASRSIEPGDELFLDFKSLPKHFPFDASTPTEESYQTADAIVADMMEVSRPKVAPVAKTKKKKTKGKLATYTKSKDVKKITAEGIKDSLELVKVALSRVDPKIASLLPTTYIQLNKTSTLGSSYISLNNRSLAWLNKNGKCINDENLVQIRASATVSSEKGIFAARFISKGELIMPIPLYAYGEKEPENHPFCFHSPSSFLVLCSLTFQSFVSHRAAIDSSESATAKCNEGEEGGNAGNCQLGPNAVYQWSPWNPWNDVLMKKDSKEIIKMHATSLSFDLVAMHDIQEGEEISINYGVEWEAARKEYISTKSIQDDTLDTFCQPIRLPDEIVPSAWRIR